MFLLAGAGSGKTRVIIERIKYLIREDVDPLKILAITFTHKAAIEMKERLSNEYVSVHTFHQFALKILKANLSYDYKILSEDLKEFTREERLKISIYKNHVYQSRKPKAYERYQQLLKENHQKDFDDILLDLLAYLKTHKNKLDYDYIFVDEFQDTNELQYLILKLLINDHTSTLAVGDPDQSIYQFRGANSKIIERYIKDFKAEVLVLNLNYRSSPHIIKIANRFIETNLRKHKKELIPFNEENYETNKLVFNTLLEEAKFIVERYRGFILTGTKPKDIAVLYRNHHRAHIIRREIQKLYMDSIYKIQLLTMHQAKGLEFDVVFIIGLEDKEMPSHHTTTYLSLEEEKRLMYVAITRAKKYLYLTCVKNNYHVHRQPSRFYKSIKTK